MLDPLETATLILLFVTIIILATGAVKPELKQKGAARDDFSLIMMLFVGGWFATDVLSAVVAEQWQSWISLSYMLVLGGFLVLMVRRLRWAEVRSAARTI